MFSIQRFSPALFAMKDVRFQPIDTRDVATHLVSLIDKGPAGRVDDIGGPAVFGHDELARMYLTSRGSRRRVVALPVPGGIVAGLKSGANLVPANPVGKIGFDQYLARIHDLPVLLPLHRRLVTDDHPSVAKPIGACSGHRSHAGSTAPRRRRGRRSPADDRIRGAADQGVRGQDIRRTGSPELRPARHDEHHRRGGPCHPAPSTLLLAIMSGFERRGRWNVPRKLTTFALWGGGVVDLRYADFTSPEVEIRTYSIMGGQTILVPPEVNVELRGHGVMGTFDHLDTEQGLPGAPLVKVCGFSLWGKVAVKRKKRRTG